VTTRYSFTKWLMQFQRESTAIGDLARRIARDTEWQDPSSSDAMESQLSGAGVSAETVQVARRAWRRYASDTAAPRPRS
jgi:hypothetical protein